MDKQIRDNLKLDNQLCFALYSASLAMNKIYKPLLQGLELTYPQYLIMLVLWEEDGITATTLGKKLMQDLGALSPVIKRLEVQGLVERRRSQEDERKIELHLTAAGKAMHAQAGSLPEQILCASELNIDDLKTLKARLDELRESLQKQL